MQQFILKASSKGFKKAHKLEAKIVFITSAYIVASSLVLITYSYSNFIIRDQFFQNVGRFYLCQSTGLQSGTECDEAALTDGFTDLQLYAFYILLGVVIILHIIAPIGFLILFIKCNCHYKFNKLSV